MSGYHGIWCELANSTPRGRPRSRLRAIAVVDVKIGDRDAGQAVHVERVRSGDRDRITAEAHRHVAGGVVPGGRTAQNAARVEAVSLSTSTPRRPRPRRARGA